MSIDKGIIYILGNLSMIDPNTREPIFKIGKTKDLNGRMTTLNRETTVPHPFKCVFACELNNYNKVEKDLHKAFEEYRVNNNREYFNIKPELIIPLLKHFSGFNDITPSEEDSLKTDNSIEEVTKIPDDYYTYSDLKQYLDVTEDFCHGLFGYRVSCLHTRKNVKTYKTKESQYYRKDLFLEAAKKENILKEE